MERVIFVEVLGRRGDVRQRFRVDALPFRIGRGYHNDLILDDPYVSPAHAQIEGDAGGLTLRDLGSQNGVQGPNGASRFRDAAVDVSVPADFRIGRTRVRVRDAAHPVEATLMDPTASARRRVLRQPWLALAVFAAVAFFAVNEELDGSQRMFDWGHSAERILTGALLIALWVGLWSLITRVLTPHSRLLDHWVVAGSYALFEAVMRWAGTWIRFFVASITPVQLFEIALQLGAATLLFFAHLTLTGALRAPRRALLAGLLSLAFVSLSQLDTVFRRPDWVQILPYWSRLQPLDPGWLATQSVDGFFEGTAGVRNAVDTLALRAAASENRKDTP